MKNRFSAFMMIALLAITTVFSSCKKDDDDNNNVTPVSLVEDGIYIKGDAADLVALDTKGAMAKGFNEVTKKYRAGMYEKFVALKAGMNFNIVKKTGATESVYGAGTLASTDITGNDQPTMTIQKGTFAIGGAAFTVPVDGLYHVVLDDSTQSMAIIPVKSWGIIGAAALGWGDDLQLPLKGAFSSTALSFEATNVKLTPGEFKIRYGAGWKVEIDADSKVKCETSFGGTVDALAFGGANLTWAAAGFYTVDLNWTLDGGIKFTTTKTGDVASSDWTGVVLDAVGDGVSADNTSAIADPSGWGWGNKLLADNAGLPTAVGNVYTWTWTGMTIEAAMGFKLRTEDGVAPANGNGANFDIGLDGVDHAASSANVDAATTGNITVTTKAVYKITLTIDAANADAKNIVIE